MANKENLTIPKKGEVRNPNGRPKKSFTLLNQQLKNEGYEILTKSALNEAYSLILSLDEAMIQELTEDETQPFAIRLIIQEMRNPSTSGKTIQDMRNYLFGTATNTNEVKVTENPLKGIDWNKLSEEQVTTIKDIIESQY